MKNRLCRKSVFSYLLNRENNVPIKIRFVLIANINGFLNKLSCHLLDIISFVPQGSRGKCFNNQRIRIKKIMCSRPEHLF